MKILPALLLLFAVWLGALVRPVSAAAEEFPYRGHWSNGRGETLVVTATTIRFAGGRAVSYRDITKATDGHLFELQITARGEVNGFSGKFLSVTCKREQMKMVSFASHADLFQDTGSLDELTWFKDSGEDE